MLYYCSFIINSVLVGNCAIVKRERPTVTVMAPGQESRTKGKYWTRICYPSRGSILVWILPLREWK